MMKSLKPWVDAFGIPHEDYKNWCTHVPADKSITYWCMAEGRIQPGAYLEWASRHYGLCVLRPEFFERPANKELFEKYKSVANWSPEMIPIHEWDGVLFVACVEPADGAHWSFPVQYVLASSSELDQYWNQLQMPVAAKPLTPPPAPPEDTPAPYPAAPKTPPPPAAEKQNTVHEASGPLNLNLNLKPTPQGKDRDFMEELAAQVGSGGTSDAPENLQWSETAVGKSDDDATKPAIPEPAPESAAPDLEMPEGLTLNIPMPSAMPETPPMPDLTFTAIKAPNETAPPSPLDPTNTPVPATAGTTTDATSITGMDEEAKKFGEPLFQEFAGQFEGVMILKLVNKSFVPWCWDANFAAPDHKGPAVDLSPASAFRIAYRTKLPYLGHIVETPANLDFFKGWGYSNLPEYIIVHPLLQDNNCVGALLLKADKSKKQSHLLSASEVFAKRVSHALSLLSPKAA